LPEAGPSILSPSRKRFRVTAIELDLDRDEVYPESLVMSIKAKRFMEDYPKLDLDKPAISG